MVVLEWFLYLVGIVIGYASFRFNWWLFPKKLSRWKRYRMSEYDFFVDRVIAAVAGAVVFGGGSIYCVYMAFHKDLLKPKKAETAVVQPAPMIQENTGKTSASKSTLEAMEQPIPNGTELDEVTEIVHLWDKAHNQRNYVLFDSLYMDYVRFYGQEWEKQRCVQAKNDCFKGVLIFPNKVKIFVSKIREMGVLKCFLTSAYIIVVEFRPILLTCG